MKLRFLNLVVSAALLIITAVGKADTLSIGALSYDSGVVPGKNSFDLYNLTAGLLAPGPDAISDDLLFSGKLVLNIGGTASTYSFSNIDSLGGTSYTIASVLPSANILSATLFVTLNNSTGVTIYNNSGTLVSANLQAVPNTVLAGPLTACDGVDPCTAPATITVATQTGLVITPEPTSLWLTSTGLMLAAVMNFRLRRHAMAFVSSS